jgi:poly-gamma-glutamate synthesis protein (capsule biosynthesis protein)
MIHGGNENQGQPTPLVERMINAARSAGATLILNHHPHVLGGLRWDGTSLVATSLGNLLFDQTLWTTFPSLLLEIHLRHGVVTRVTGFPLLIHGYRPHAAVGELASWVLRGVMASEPGPWILEAGVLESDFGGRRETATRSMPLHADPKRGGLWRIPPGVGLCGHNGNGTLELGHDLLGVGSFEDELVAGLPRAGALWNLSGVDKQVIPEAAHRGGLGVRLHRSGFNRQPVLLTTLHHLQVTPGQHLSLLSWIRGSAGAKARLQLSWYAARHGASQARLEHPISSLVADRWQPIRWDVKVPDHTLALGLFLALEPGGAGRHHMDVDDVALIHWQPSVQPRQSQEWIRLRGGGKLCLQRSTLPGGPKTPISLQRFG